MKETCCRIFRNRQYTLSLDWATHFYVDRYLRLQQLPRRRAKKSLHPRITGQQSPRARLENMPCSMDRTQLQDQARFFVAKYHRTQSPRLNTVMNKEASDLLA